MWECSNKMLCHIFFVCVSVWRASWMLEKQSTTELSPYPSYILKQNLTNLWEIGDSSEWMKFWMTVSCWHAHSPVKYPRLRPVENGSHWGLRGKRQGLLFGPRCGCWWYVQKMSTTASSPQIFTAWRVLPYRLVLLRLASTCLFGSMEHHKPSLLVSMCIIASSLVQLCAIILSV